MKNKGVLRLLLFCYVSFIFSDVWAQTYFLGDDYDRLFCGTPEASVECSSYCAAWGDRDSRCGDGNTSGDDQSGRDFRESGAADKSGLLKPGKTDVTGNDGSQKPPTNTSTTTTAAATTAASTLSNQVTQLETNVAQSCEQKSERAGLCCGEPATCIGEAFGASANTSNIGVKLLQMTATGIIGLGASSGISQMCGNMKNVAYASAALNTAMATICSSKVSQCKGTCGDYSNQIDDMISTNQVSLDANPEVSARLRTLKTKVSRLITDCAKADNATIRAGMQAFASAQAAKTAELCQAQTGPGVTNLTENTTTADCTAAGAAANPVCQAMCARPGAENDPICANILRNLNGGNSGNTTTVGNRGNGNSGFDTGFDTTGGIEDKQEANFGNNTPQHAGLNGGNSGGGGGGGGLPAQGGGDSGGYGGVAGSGSESSILKGTSSGNGYSQGAGGLRTGGNSGYAGAGGGARNPASDPNQKFSLKDFLPGGKMAPKRGLAGMVGGNPEIGSKTDDIFKRISGRFYQLCLQDRLQDCSTLRNLKKGP